MSKLLHLFVQFVDQNILKYFTSIKYIFDQNIILIKYIFGHSLAVKKHYDERQPGKERTFLILYYPGKLEQELRQGRALEAGTGADAVGKCCLLACSL